MKLSTFGFLTGRGLRNLGTHWAMTIACVASLAVCMSLNTLASLVEVNVDSMIGYLGRQNETVVFLDPECDDATATAVGEQISAISGVTHVSYMSKQDVLSTYEGYLDEQYEALWDEFESDNPFKANYRVTVGDLSQLNRISSQMEKIPGVVKVTAPVEMGNIFVEIQQGVTRMGRAFVLVLMVVSVITVGSTIRLSVFARRREIEIMKYVGATNFLVTLPFLVEGLAMGLISGVLSASCILALYSYLVSAASTLSGVWDVLVGTSLVPLEAVWTTVLTSSVAGGALVGGLGEKTRDLTLNRAYNVTRQTGSAIKPIGAYALGIEYGLVNWSTMLNNSPLYLKSDMVIRDDDYCRRNGLSGLSDEALRAYPNAWRSWPKNYGGNYGDNTDVPLWNGLARSLNTIAVRVGDLVGANTIFNFLYNTLQLDTLDPVNDVGLAPLVMGSQTHGVSPLDLAAAFQIFYDGQYTTPRLYTRVLDRDGNIYLESNATSYQALTPQTATIMNQLLQNVLYSSVGTAGGRYPTAGNMRSFGKTGTATDERDLWFVGGTPYYVTAVWWGYDSPYDMTLTLGSQAKTRVCVEAWKALMNTVQEGYETKEFPMAEGVVQRSYCTESGLLAGPACTSRATGYYKADDLPATCNYDHSGGILSAQVDTEGIITD